jgi:hypothetical protein
LEEEMTTHIIWQCSSARDVWCVGPKELQKCTDWGSEFLQVVEGIFAKYSFEVIAQFVGIARMIWLRRNEVVYGGGFLHPKLLVQQSVKAAEDFSLVWGQKESRTLETLILDRWNAPFVGWMKVNSDASVDKTKGWLGYGVVVQDACGVVLAAQCRTMMGNLDVSLAEAGAMMMATQLCKRMGYNMVHFESDAQIVVDGIKSVETDWSSKGLMMEDIK